MEAIYDIGGTLDLAVTLQDDIARGKSGRVYVDTFCEKHKVELIKVGHVNDKLAVREFVKLDWLFIIGWSQIANAKVVRAPSKGVLGMHPTLLPIGRGRAAISWAILKQLDKTGVTLFKLDEGVDTGPILAQLEIPLTEIIDAGMLYQMVNSAHIKLMTDVYPKLVTNSVRLREQDHDAATVWPERTPEEGQIDLAGSVRDAERMVRAVTKPYPGAFYYDDGGKKITVWSATITNGPTSERTLCFTDGYLELGDWDIL